MFDLTIHLGDLIVAAGFIVGGLKFSLTVRDRMQGLEQTVYGSQKPPVEGLVSQVERHEKVILGLR